MDAAIHAREHMTTNVLMEMIDNYTVAYRKSSSFAGYNVKSTLNKTSIWFVPMMNPDGVTLVQKVINSIDSKYRARLKQYNHCRNYAASNIAYDIYVYNVVYRSDCVTYFF